MLRRIVILSSSRSGSPGRAWSRRQHSPSNAATICQSTWPDVSVAPYGEPEMLWTFLFAFSSHYTSLHSRHVLNLQNNYSKTGVCPVSLVSWYRRSNIGGILFLPLSCLQTHSLCHFRTKGQLPVVRRYGHHLCCIYFASIFNCSSFRNGDTCGLFLFERRNSGFWVTSIDADRRSVDVDGFCTSPAMWRCVSIDSTFAAINSENE